MVRLTERLPVGRRRTQAGRHSCSTSERSSSASSRKSFSGNLSFEHSRTVVRCSMAGSWKRNTPRTELDALIEADDHAAWANSPDCSAPITEDEVRHPVGLRTRSTL